MSWRATAAVKPLLNTPAGRRLTPTEKLVLFILADYHDDERGCAWPSVDRLAKEALCTTRNVQLVLKRLAGAGMLRIHSEAGKSNRYYFPFLEQSSMEFRGEINSGVKSGALGGEAGSTEGRNAEHLGGEIASSPKPPLEPPLEPSKNISAFHTFWERYPKKLDKAAAMKAWRKIPASEIPEVLRGLAAWMPHWSDPQYIPYAATWLNKFRWREVPENGNGNKSGWSIPQPQGPNLYELYLEMKEAGRWTGNWEAFSRLPADHEFKRLYRQRKQANGPTP